MLLICKGYYEHCWQFWHIKHNYINIEKPQYRRTVENGANLFGRLSACPTRHIWALYARLNVWMPCISRKKNLQILAKNYIRAWTAWISHTKHATTRLSEKNRLKIELFDQKSFFLYYTIFFINQTYTHFDNSCDVLSQEWRGFWKYLGDLELYA